MSKTTEKSPRKAIICFQEKDRKWRIKIDGKQHPSDFVSARDCRIWVGVMWDNGLYTGRPLYLMSETGALNPTTPAYED